GSYRPELLLLLLAGRRKESERFGIRRPGWIRVDPPLTRAELNRDRRDRVSISFADGDSLCFKGRRGLDPGDEAAIGRKRDIAAQDGFTEIPSQLHVLSCYKRREEKGQKKILHAGHL